MRSVVVAKLSHNYLTMSSNAEEALRLVQYRTDPVDNEATQALPDGAPICCPGRAPTTTAVYGERSTEDRCNPVFRPLSELLSRTKDPTPNADNAASAAQISLPNAVQTMEKKLPALP